MSFYFCLNPEKLAEAAVMVLTRSALDPGTRLGAELWLEVCACGFAAVPLCPPWQQG